MIARIIDCFDLIFNRNVIKEQRIEDKQYNDLLIENDNLKHDVEIITVSRDRYLENCKKRSAEKKEYRKEIKEKDEKIRILEKRIKELENGKGSV